MGNWRTVNVTGTMSPGVTDSILRFAVSAADRESLKAPPVSSVPNPDGSRQRETPAERTRRVVEAAVLHLLEQGLVVVPGDIDQRLDAWIPLFRSQDGAEPV